MHNVCLLCLLSQLFHIDVWVMQVIKQLEYLTKLDAKRQWHLASAMLSSQNEVDISLGTFCFHSASLSVLHGPVTAISNLSVSY